MKSWMKNRMAIAGVALLLTTCLLSIGGAAIAAEGSNSGIEGVEGPTFTFGVVLLGSTGESTPPSGAAGKVFNAYPYAITGFAMSKSEGTMSVWVSSCSQAVLDLGFKPGDIVNIYCTPQQVENINTGDWVLISGFTVRGQLAFATEQTLPAPFTY